MASKMRVGILVGGLGTGSIACALAKHGIALTEIAMSEVQDPVSVISREELPFIRHEPNQREAQWKRETRNRPRG